MVDVSYIGDVLTEAYNFVTTGMPAWGKSFVGLFLIVILIFLYSIAVWKFYRFIAKKDIIELNLSQYNKYKNEFLEKAADSILYIVEYILVLPFVIFFWFSLFTLFLIFLTENIPLNSLLIISATITAAIRMLAYHNENIAKEVAKILPFMLLAVSILNPQFFSIERIFGQFSQITGFFGEIAIYLVFIIILELVLRFFYFIFSLFGLSDEELEETRKKSMEEDDEEED